MDTGRRQFLIALTSFFGVIGAIFAAIPFISSWLPSAKARAAGAPVDIDISSLDPGGQMTVAWRGKPVWIIRRTSEQLDRLEKIQYLLEDPDSEVDQQPQYAENFYRSINPEYLVLVGLCTHLGCSPTYRPDVGGLGPEWPGGFFCPCHGSKFDLAGRVFEGVPAPINMEVPPYKFISDTVVRIGEHTEIT